MDKKHWFGGLRWKFFFGFLVVSLLPLWLFAFSTSSIIQNYFVDNRVKELMRKANEISDTIKQANYLTDSTKFDYFTSDINSRAEGEAFRILVIDNSGMVIQDTNGTENGVIFVSPEVIDALNKKSVSPIQEDKETLYIAVPILNDNDSAEVAGVVLLISSVSDIYKLLEYIQSMVVSLTIVTTIIAVVGVLFLSQLIIRPLKKILRVVNLMSEGHLNQRIEISGHDEFTQMGIAFNNMNDKLEQVEKTREEFVSNVSHELKTPLSSIKVLSESILFQEGVPIDTYKEFLQDINSEVDRMTYIVNDLLTLVKLDQRDVPINIKPTEINKMVEDILKRLYPLAEQKKIELLYEDVRKVTIAADEMKLGLAISNLVENGIKYTPNGGSVKVIIDSDHQNAFITVQDTGIGIAEEEQSKIFTRFYRVDKTRDRDTGGTGLGLSITHSTVLLHNGSIRLTSKEGEGTTFVIRLPIHQNS